MGNVRQAAKLKRLFGTCSLAAALMSPSISPQMSWAAEHNSEPTVLAASPAGGKISEEQARQIAVKAVPGEITDATIEKKLGKMVWVIEIVAEKGGAETDVLVDMMSGKVLGVER